MNVSVFTKYRSDVDEYENVVVHARVSGSRRTACGLDLQKVKVWEPTKHASDCRRCARAKAAS